MAVRFAAGLGDPIVIGSDTALDLDQFDSAFAGACAGARAGLERAIVDSDAYWPSNKEGVALPVEAVDETSFGMIRDDLRAAFDAEPLMRDPEWLLTKPTWPALIQAALEVLCKRAAIDLVWPSAKACADGEALFAKHLRNSRH